MVMVTGSPAAIEALEGKGYDVGFVGELNEAGVYVDDASEARLRAEGYTIGKTVEDEGTRLAVKAQTAAVAEGEALAASVATNGLTKAAKAKGAVNVPGNVVIQRAYTFTNYAGRFLYVEAHNKLHGDTTGPAMSFTYTSPNGTSQVYNLSNSTITPDGTDAGIGGNKLSDGDAGAGARYMYHRGLVALLAPTRPSQAADVSVRVADANGNFDTAGVTEWASKALPPRVAAFQKDFISKYMDPTEIYNRMDSLVTQFPDLIQSINLPEKTGGYSRPAMAMMAGTTAGNGTPNATLTPGAVYLTSKARGDLGGNNITAEFKNPGAEQRAAVDHGDRRHVARPRPRGRQRGRRDLRDRPARQGHRRQPGDGRDRRDHQHGRAGRRGDQRRSGRERAGERHDVPPERGHGRRRGDRGAHVPGRRRDDRWAELLVHEGQALGLHARRHGLLGRQLHRHPADARAHGLAPRHPRPVPAEGVPDRQGPLQQRGRRLPVLPAARA